MTFDNKTKAIINSDLVREEARLPAVSSSVLFEIFPFVMVFGEDMGVQSIGRYQYLYCQYVVIGVYCIFFGKKEKKEEIDNYVYFYPGRSVKSFPNFLDRR